MARRLVELHRDRRNSRSQWVKKLDTMAILMENCNKNNIHLWNIRVKAIANIEIQISLRLICHNSTMQEVILQILAFSKIFKLAWILTLKKRCIRKLSNRTISQRFPIRLRKTVLSFKKLAPLKEVMLLNKQLWQSEGKMTSSFLNRKIILKDLYKRN